MKTSTHMLTLILGASTISAAHAERLDVTLEGTVRSIVSEVYEFNITESPGGLPFDWGKVGERHPEESEGFHLGKAFKMRFAFETTTNALIDAELSNDEGRTWQQGGLSPYIMGMSETAWSLGFAMAKSQDDVPGETFYFGSTLAFAPGAYPADGGPYRTAGEHLQALAGLTGAAPYLHTDLLCNGPGHPGEEVCTMLHAAVDKVTFTSSQGSVTVAVPEASPASLAMAGLALVALVALIGTGRRHRGS